MIFLAGLLIGGGITAIVISCIVTISHHRSWNHGICRHCGEPFTDCLLADDKQHLIFLCKNGHSLTV